MCPSVSEIASESGGAAAPLSSPVHVTKDVRQGKLILF